jgi:hypothetical protein
MKKYIGKLEKGENLDESEIKNVLGIKPKDVLGFSDEARTQKIQMAH